jgi:hypothetical protein
MYDSDELRALAVAAQGRAMVEAVLEVSPETVLALLDEIEALRADALRYRWIRSTDTDSHEFPHMWHVLTPDELDARIDTYLTQGGGA